MAKPIRGFTNDTSNAAQNLVNNVLAQAPGLLSAKPAAKYASGPRCVIKINNQLMGFAFDVTWQITTENVEIKTIDDYIAYELVPNRISVEGTMSAFHIPGAGASAQLIQANLLSFLFHKYITLEIKDSATDELLFISNKVVITSRSENLSAEKLAQVQLTWKAIGWEDEIKPEPPQYFDSAPKTDPSIVTRLTDIGQIGTNVSRFFK